MEYVIEQILAFALTNGWQLALIAFLGIVLLGVLKYAKVFDKVADGSRKPIYLAISVGTSLIGSIIYLLIVKQFQIDLVIGLTPVLYALNQTMYSVYENTKLRDLLAKLFGIISQKLKKETK